MAEKTRIRPERQDRFTWKAGEVEWVKKPPKKSSKSSSSTKKKK